MLKHSEKSLVPMYKKIMFFSSELSWFSVTLFAVLFYASLSRLAVPFFVMLGGIVIVAAIVCFIFPLIYHAINRSTLIVMGRYHFPLIISTFVAAFSVVICFSVNLSDLMNMFVSLSCLCAFMISFLTFEHIVLNLGLRLFSYQSFDRIKKTGMFFGILSFFIVLFSVYKLNYTEILGYAAGIVMLISGVLVYFSTVSSMPRFISLETPEKITFKKRFITFFSLLKRKDYRVRTLTLALIGGGIGASILTVLVKLLTISLPLSLAFVSPLVVVTAISTVIFYKYRPDNHISFILSTVFFSLVPIAAVLILVAGFVALPYAVIFAFVVFAGVSLALAISILIHSVANFFFLAETEGLASLSRASGNRNLLYLVIFLISLFVLSIGKAFEPLGEGVVGIVAFSFSVAIMVLAVIMFFVFPLNRELRELVEEEQKKKEKKQQEQLKRGEAKNRKASDRDDEKASIKAQMENSIKDKLKEIILEEEKFKTITHERKEEATSSLKEKNANTLEEEKTISPNDIAGENKGDLDV